MLQNVKSDIFQECRFCKWVHISLVFYACFYDTSWILLLASRTFMLNFYSNRFIFSLPYKFVFYINFILASRSERYSSKKVVRTINRFLSLNNFCKACMMLQNFGCFRWLNYPYRLHPFKNDTVPGILKTMT